MLLTECYKSLITMSREWQIVKFPGRRRAYSGGWLRCSPPAQLFPAFARRCRWWRGLPFPPSVPSLSPSSAACFWARPPRNWEGRMARLGSPTASATIDFVVSIPIVKLEETTVSPPPPPIPNFEEFCHSDYR